MAQQLKGTWPYPEPTRAQKALLDSIAFEAVWLDSVSTNGFIGMWSARITVKDGPRTKPPVTLTCWTDTTETLAWTGPNLDTCLFRHVDLPTNRLITVLRPPGKWASLHSLRDIARHNGNVLSWLVDQEPPEETGRKRMLLGRSCTEHEKPVGSDTIRYSISSITPSPFRDVVKWMALGRTTELFGRMAFDSDRMPLFAENESAIVEVISVQQGIVPRPVFDHHAYPLKDERRDTLLMPLRRGPAQYWTPGWYRQADLNVALGRHPDWTEPPRASRSAPTTVPRQVVDPGPPEVVPAPEPPPPVREPVVVEPPYTGPPWFTVDVKGRTLIAQPNPPKDVKKKCEVAVAVSVDGHGSVGANGIDETRTFFATQEMKELALQLVRKMKFEPIAGASLRTVQGLITFRFERGM